MASLTYTVLEYHNLDGSKKLWAISEGPESTGPDAMYVVRHGRAGNRLNTRRVDQDVFWNDRVAKKLKKGYRQIAHGVFIDEYGNWRVPRSTETPEPTSDPVKPLEGVFWTFIGPQEELRETAQRIRERIVGAMPPERQNSARVKLSGEWLGELLAGTPPKDDYAGMTPLHTGLEGLLFTLAMAREAEEAALSFDGIVVMPSRPLQELHELFVTYETDLKEARALAEAIGLVEPKIDLERIQPEEPGFFF